MPALSQIDVPANSEQARVEKKQASKAFVNEGLIVGAVGCLMVSQLSFSQKAFSETQRAHVYAE